MPLSATGTLPPVANNDGGFTTAPGTALSIPVATLLANDSDPNGLTISINGVGNPVGGTVAINGSNVVFTPTSGFTGAASFTYTITNGQLTSNVATVSLSVAVVVPTNSLFAATSTPSVVTENDSGAVELGVKFQVSTAGTATGVRFYKGPSNTGTHVGNLWSPAGSLTGQRYLHQRKRERLAAGPFLDSGQPGCRVSLYGLLSHQRWDSIRTRPTSLRPR